MSCLAISRIAQEDVGSVDPSGFCSIVILRHATEQHLHSSGLPPTIAYFIRLPLRSAALEEEELDIHTCSGRINRGPHRERHLRLSRGNTTTSIPGDKSEGRP